MAQYCEYRIGCGNEAVQISWDRLFNRKVKACQTCPDQGRSEGEPLKRTPQTDGLTNATLPNRAAHSRPASKVTDSVSAHMLLNSVRG